MNPENHPFGLSKERSYEEETYLGKWVVIYSQIGKSYGGKFVGMEKGFYKLCPFTTGEYNSEGKLVHIVMETEVLSIPSVPPCIIEPTSESNIMNYCISANKSQKDIGLNGKESKKE